MSKPFLCRLGFHHWAWHTPRLAICRHCNKIRWNEPPWIPRALLKLMKS